MLSTPVNVLTERLNYVKRCKVKLFVNTDTVCLLFQYLKLDLQKHLVYTNMRTLFLGHWERHEPRCALRASWSYKAMAKLYNVGGGETHCLHITFIT